MKNKLFLASLAAAVAIPSVVAPIQAQEVRTEVTQDFTDVSKSYSFYKEIMAMTKDGIIHGHTDGSFKPQQSITRMHTAMMFERALELAPVRAGKEFKDVPKTHMYYNTVQKVYRAGIFDGKTNGEFGIADNLTRAQMAKVMVEAFNLDIHKGYIFDDVGESHWAKDYISSLYMSGITVGSNGKFNPSDPVSRAHYAAFLYRALNPDDAPVPEKPLKPYPPKPEVKPDPKPEPKPEPTPPSSDGLKEPSGLPGGATLTDKREFSHVYSYNRSLPGGGSISKVTVHPDYGGQIIMRGVDNNGTSFTAQYVVSQNAVQYTMSNPKFTINDSTILHQVGRAFAYSYGMR